MFKRYPLRLNERIHLIDGYDLSIPERTGTYVIKEEQVTIVETGPSPSVEHVKKGLEKLGISLEEIRYIIVTHVHLDHAGGAGLLLRDCPNAKVVVHTKGARHLSDPKRLIAGAKAVYAHRFSGLFEPVVPIPEDRLLAFGESDQLKIGPLCTLEFLDTPGHANHHFSIYDPVSHGVFAGDAVGIRYEQLADEGIDLFLPSTSPNQFDPKAMGKTIERLRAMELGAIYFGHFGMTTKPNAALNQVSAWLPIFVEQARMAAAEGKGPDELAKRLYDLVAEKLLKQGVREEHEVYPIIELDMQVSAMGLMDFLSKQ
ncbi:glyoxylase-like metal-dependent hydrolase (beta-lactamase superfamily II) [Planomicrobium soli]|uniref:Glyoxylase-like metal-dependent hydrolase (Beta-lactamase superfamily II) n=1 Tax=Planomicrobium soli TaxID=1176648 RepID=A0A2P8H6C9_9BACL|nr:MBL fold metallo-hydrolase [Planomicrobium soli]PSL41759.1 glyoxylase-like metal-dependent hydrolase (beta-lactamase superfamily II) [Planomicrobium soli]